MSTQIYIYGEGAYTTLANKIASSIYAVWSKNWEYTDSDGNVFDIVFDVQVDVYDSEDPTNNTFIIPDAWNPSSTNNYIKINKGDGRSNVQAGDEGTWHEDDPMKVFAHEWGHLVGLKDRYHDKYYIFGGHSIADDGWKNNLMGNVWGPVDQRNIDGIVENSVNKYNKSKAKEKGEEFQTKIDKAFANK